MALCQHILLDRTKLEIGARIGAGGFGYVHEGKYNGQPCAVKAMKGPPDSKKDEYSLLAEIEHGVSLQSPLICQLIGFVPAAAEPDPGAWDPLSGVLLVSQLMKPKSLEFYARNEAGKDCPADWPTIKSKCILGMAAGLVVLHKSKTIHRDFKLGNVLLNDQWEPCITDFGLARRGAMNLDYAQGTMFLTAPEVIKAADGKLVFTEKVDVYAYGVALYQLFSRNWTKFDNGYELRKGTCMQMLHQYYKQIASGARPFHDPAIPPFIWELITKCWHQDPDKRPLMSAVLDTLSTHMTEFAVPGTDMSELARYKDRVLDSLVFSDDYDSEYE